MPVDSMGTSADNHSMVPVESMGAGLNELTNLVPATPLGMSMLQDEHRVTNPMAHAVLVNSAYAVELTW